MADKRETLNKVVSFLQKCIEGKRTANVENMQKFVDYVVECRENGMISHSEYKSLKKNMVRKFGSMGIAFNDSHLVNEGKLNVFDLKFFQNKKIRTAVASFALVGAITSNSMNIGRGRDTIAFAKEATLETEDAKDAEVNTENKEGKQNVELSKADIVKLYNEGTITPITDYLARALPNGIYSASEKNVIARQGLHDFWIANIKQLDENDKLAFASSTNQVAIQEWFNLSAQVADDMVDVTPETIPFDASQLFKRDVESAKLVNQVMDIFARWNVNKGDKAIEAEWQAFCADIHNHLNDYISRNPAAVELVLSIISQGQTPGTDLHAGIEGNVLYDGTTSDLNQARVALVNLLHVDFAIVQDDNKEVYEEILDTKELQNTGFAGLEDANTALQVKFAANVEELSLKQIQSFSSKLKLNGTRNAWGAFSDDVANAITDGKFDDKVANVLFANQEDANNIKELNSIVKAYVNAKTKEEKAKYYNDYNTFAYKFSVQLEERTNKNDAASDLILNTISKIEQKNLGLHLDREDVLEGNLENGTKGLYKILVGDGLTPDCNITDTILDENGNVVANRTFWQENRAELMYRIGCIEITKQATKNVDAGESIAESIILEYKDKVSHEKNNRSEVIIESIAEKIKNVKFVANMNREDYYTSLYNDWNIGGFGTGSSGQGSGQSGNQNEPANEETRYSGKGKEDNGLPIWSKEKVKKTEKEAKDEINKDYGFGVPGVTDIHFEEVDPEVIEEETVVEWVDPTEEEKEKNEEGIKEGEITEADVSDGSSYDNDGTEFDYDEVDDLTQEGIDKILDLQDKLENGQISQDDFDASVKDIYAQYGKNDQEQSKPSDSANQDQKEDANKPSDSNDKEDETNKEENNNNTPSQDQTNVSDKSLEDLLATGEISQEEYDMIVNNQVPVEGEQNQVAPSEGTVMENDGIIFIADGNGNWVEQNTNTKDEDISSSFQEATKEEQDANTTDVKYEPQEVEATRSDRSDDAAKEQERKEAEEAQRAAKEQEKKEAEEAQRAAEEQKKREAEEAQRAAEEQKKREAEEAQRAAEEQKKREAEEAQRAAIEQERKEAKERQRQIEELKQMKETLAQEPEIAPEKTL